MHIHIVGTGHMAGVLGAASCDAGVGSSVWTGGGSDKSVPDAVLVHIGSGRQFEEALRWCGATSTPFIQASTGQDGLLPTQPPCPIILAPNLALPVIKLFEVLPRIAETFKEADMAIEITESHQARKKTVAGTALEFAKILGVPASAIRSVRDPAEQEALGVPREHLDAHAYHWITFTSDGLKIQLSTQVEGSRAYASGALVVAEKLIAKRGELQNRIYSLQEVLSL